MRMENKICIYLAEGECEEKLLKALKVKPELIAPGRVKRFNVIQNELKPSHLMGFPARSRIVLVFDTDKEETEHLKKNMDLLRAQFGSVGVLTIPQVLNFEDEIERSTDLSSALELTKSKSLKDFKTAVNKAKETDFRSALKRNRFEIKKLWIKKPGIAFKFVRQDSEKIKL